MTFKEFEFGKICYHCHKILANYALKAFGP